MESGELEVRGGHGFWGTHRQREGLNQPDAEPTAMEFYPGIEDEKALGRMYILDFGAIQIPEYLIDYIDYEAYGRDVAYQ